MLREYRREWLPKDVVAGLVLTTLLVPQGMAYAELAGLPAITGLYTSILCLVGYAIFGPSKILVLGPDSSLGPMIAATTLPLIAANGLVDETRAFVDGVQDGETVGASLAVGVLALAVIAVLRRTLPRVPNVLVAVVVSIAVAAGFGLEQHGVKLVGTLPEGFPPLTVPDVHRSDLLPLLGGAFGIALVSLADTIATSSAFAGRSGEEVDGNREMVGIGVANLGAGFFQGFPISTSGSRTAVAEQAGAKTQVTGLVGAILIAAMLLFFPGMFRDLPQPTLAAVVITASLSLADVPGTVRL